ncbi:GNAT family N-acetyltransferase [Ferruginibacter sp.]|nr:GNAT family N-acetyltransferase [Ferruginibacter sp.]
MEQNFISLDKINVAELVYTFNEAFRNYYVPLKISEASLMEKMQVENIDLSISIGFLVNNKLAGFILIATGEISGTRYAYNAGTGVLAECRGKNLTKQMYNMLLPQLNKAGIRHHVLEVIKDNKVAINVYQKVGFVISRSFYCYLGRFNKQMRNADFVIQGYSLNSIHEISMDFDTMPAWQNSAAAIVRAANLKTLAVFYKEVLAGFISFCTTSGRVWQFAVKKEFRQKGIATALFFQVQSLIGDKDISVTHIDINDFSTVSFLRQSGLCNFIDTYEMKAVF